MSKFEYLWKLTMLALALVACFLVYLCYYHWATIAGLANTGLWSVTLSLQIVGYSLPVAALLAVGLAGYASVFTVYHRVKLQQVAILHAMNEAEAVGLTVHSVSSKKSAVIVAPNRQPIMLQHTEPAENLALVAGGDPLPCLIEMMLKLDRILLVGGSGSGKTEAMKHYVTRLAGNGNRLTIIDPHSPSKLAGVDVIGAKLNFASIEAKMIEIMLDVSQKYQAGNIAGDGDLGRGNQWLIVEEFRDIRKHIPEVADEFLEIMLVQARKAGYRFTIVSQNDTAGSLGLKGDMDLLKACERVEINRDLRSDSRKATIGWTKAKQFECQVPGVFSQPFATIPPSQLIIEQSKLSGMTASQRALALTVARLNGQAGSTSKNEILKLAGVSKNSSNLGFIDTIL